MKDYTTVIIGAGAAGMMCAAHAGGGCLVIDHAKAPGEKVRISGGGRCNFTNLHAAAENFLSQNPHFCKSALSRYTQWDFVELVDRHGIAWHEKTLGQLFCDDSSLQIIQMLLDEMAAAGAELALRSEVTDIRHADGAFHLSVTSGTGAPPRVRCRNLVIATGGKSIPKMGASGFAYRVAEQFGLAVTPTRPALVPFTFGPDALEWIKPLSGVAVDTRTTAGAGSFDEAVLFTHRGLSGPAALQISSYWQEGDEISVHLCPGIDPVATLKSARQSGGRRDVATVLADVLPKRLATHLAEDRGWSGNTADLSDHRIAEISATLQNWRLKPTATEGYRTAEVTLGGVDTAGLDSRTMQAREVPGLYFIGEGVDVTGWLGGYNFQWAWSSGWAVGTAIAGG